MRQNFLFIISLYFFLFLSHFICSYLFSLPFPFLLSFSSFSFFPLIFILVFLLLHYSLSSSFPPHQKAIKKGDWKPNTLKMSVNTTKDLSSLFLDAALVGERTTGMEVATLQHGGGVAKDEVDGALSCSRAE